jgi:hypothetical protein
VGSSGGRYRFATSRSEADTQSNGITRFDFRVKGSTWLVSVKAETELLMDAIQEPMLTWMVRLGDDSCARRMNMECHEKPSLSVCR